MTEIIAFIIAGAIIIGIIYLMILIGKGMAKFIYKVITLPFKLIAKAIKKEEN